MSPQKTTFIGLINHKLLKLMSVPVGKMYTVVDEGTEHGTGVSRDYVPLTGGRPSHHCFRALRLSGSVRRSQNSSVNDCCAARPSRTSDH